MAVNGVGHPADGVRQYTGGQVTIQMRMLCSMVGLKGAIIRGLHSPLPPPCAQSIGLGTLSTTCVGLVIVTSLYAVNGSLQC